MAANHIRIGDAEFELVRRDDKGRMFEGCRFAFEDVRAFNTPEQGSLRVETDDTFYSTGLTISRDEAVALRDFLNKVYPA